MDNQIVYDRCVTLKCRHNLQITATITPELNAKEREKPNYIFMLLFKTDVKSSIKEIFSTPNNNDNQIDFSSKIHMNQHNQIHMLICLTTQKINVNQTQQKTTFPHTCWNPKQPYI